MADSSDARSNRDSGYTPHWGCYVVDAAADFVMVFEPATGGMMKALSWAARFLDEKCYQEARRQKN